MSAWESPSTTLRCQTPASIEIQRDFHLWPAILLFDSGSRTNALLSFQRVRKDFAGPSRLTVTWVGLCIRRAVCSAVQIGNALLSLSCISFKTASASCYAWRRYQDIACGEYDGACITSR